jgi:SAM-dependent methyltransferase
MFDGPRPIFIDLLSFERRDPLDPIWQPYGQFIRTFVYPLLASRYLGLHIAEILLTNRDGIEPHRMVRMCPVGLLVRPAFLSTIVAPELLSHLIWRTSPATYHPRKSGSAAEAMFLLNRIFNRAGRLLHRLPRPHSSNISRYEEAYQSYNNREIAIKEDILRKALTASNAKEVLDIGCNTGRFSLLSARQGARVVAIDRDPSAAGELWKSATESNSNVLPLVIDIARPPGPLGWANEEQPSFLERAQDRFDCVLLLAMTHHLIVNERVPLNRIFDLLRRLTRKTAVVEYIDPADEQFQRILRGREELHRDLTPARFEVAAARHFRIAGSCETKPTRRIYILEK